MANYKKLKSVAHNFGHSFLSSMNYAQGDYIFEHIFKAARKAGEPDVCIDVLNQTVDPAAVRLPVILENIAHRRSWLPRMLESEDCSADQVQKMFVKIQFRFEDTQLSETVPGLELAAYDCTVEIHDDRGTVHIGKVPEGWKY
ncbi:MAG: hypothetical protein OEN50_11600 [Deltaproteobacteria bacterium]|nr:hypothetical protein [Deltaproteobacteria bacterium]